VASLQMRTLNQVRIIAEEKLFVPYMRVKRVHRDETAVYTAG
jgi:hypothetical protein